jgi:hypothetical protein
MSTCGAFAAAVSAASICAIAVAAAGQPVAASKTTLIGQFGAHNVLCQAQGAIWRADKLHLTHAQIAEA